MLSLEIKTERLKGIVNVISTLTDEAMIVFDKEGANILAVDPAHVAMVDVCIGKGAFEEYSTKECNVGIDLKKVKDVLKLASSGGTIVMSLDDDTGKLVFKVGSITRRMDALDTSDMGGKKMPELSLSARAEITSTELLRGTRATEGITDHLSVTVSEDGFELSSEGDTDASSLKVPKSELQSLSANGTFRSMFPLDYFSNIVKAIPASTNVSLEIDNDYPLYMQFQIIDKEVSVRYLIAPRIEVD